MLIGIKRRNAIGIALAQNNAIRTKGEIQISKSVPTTIMTRLTFFLTSEMIFPSLIDFLII